MSISGNRGMGKTSILVKFEELVRKENCMVLRMSNYEGNVKNIIELSNYISTNLKLEILYNKPLCEERDRLQKWISTLSPTISFNEIALKIERDKIIQEELRRRLLRLWKEMRDDYRACVILIDEAESLERIEGALIFLREVFQRVSTDANYMVVLAGKLSFPHMMSESFSPLNRFFPTSILQPFNKSEIREFFDRHLSPVGVDISDEAVDFICMKSEGHPYVLVAMAHMIFDSLEDTENYIDIDLVSETVDRILFRLAQDFFTPMYYPLTPKAKEIMSLIAENIEGLEFQFSDVVNWTNMRRNHVSPYIQELMRKGIINRIERGRYEIFHGLFIEYIRNIGDLIST